MRDSISIIGSRLIQQMGCLFTAAVLTSNGSVAAQVDGAQTPTRSRPAARFGISEVTTFDASVVSRTGEAAAERCFLRTDLPTSLTKATVDNAELILTVSAICDTSEPLIIAAFPATQSVGSRSSEWSESWTPMTGGFDPEYMALATVESSSEEIEIRLDITHFVRRWQSGELENHGVVLKALTEEKSSFEWVRDGRYDGSDAKLITSYTVDAE